MKIQCALSQSQIEKLYSNIYGHMSKEGSDFDPNQYMKELFNSIASRTDLETAAKFMQQVPSLIGTASFRPSLEEADIKTDFLRPLIKSFKNSNEGLENTIKYFTPLLNPEVKKEFVKQKELTAFTIEEKVGDLVIKDLMYFQPYSAMSTTFQEFVAMNPDEAGIEELIEPSRKTIYNTLRQINKSFSTKAALKKAEYQNVKLKLKPVRLTDIETSKLDKVTARLKERGLYLQEKGKALVTVTKPQDIFLMVLSDEKGNELYFSEEGDITSIDQGGKLVYQFYRDVRKEGNRYTVKDIYGNNDQILSAKDIVEILIKKGTLGRLTVEEKDNLVKIFDEAQQKEFKQLYDFKKKLENGESSLIKITGISNGITEFMPSMVSLQNLDKIIQNADDIIQSIDTVKSPRSGFIKGEAVVQIDGKEYGIDRPNLSDDLINKIAAVLTNPNISKKNRYEFVSQFLAPKASKSTRKHELTYLPNTDTLIFSYSKNTYKEGYDKEFTPVDLDSSTAKEEIYNALKFASGKKDNYYSAKMTYNKKLLKINGYQDYNLETGKLEDDFTPYLDLLKTLPNTLINISVGFKKRSFNSHIGFVIPNEYTKVEDIAEEREEPIQKPQLFDSLVTQDTPGEKLYKTLIEEALSEDWKNKVDATTKSTNKDVYYVSTYISNQLKTNPERFTKELALEVLNNFDIYYKPSQKQLSIINSQIEKAFTPKVEKEKSVDEIEKEINNYINPDNTSSPEDDEAGEVFFRKGDLPDNVTTEQIEEANKWWNSSPLNKYIDLKHVANIVNSNAYAAFIKHASVLNGNLGTIKIANKGSMVDVYHEAWHGFSQLFLTKKDKKALYKEVRKKLGGRKSFFEIEERLAEDFRTYAMNPKAEKNSPKRNSIFRQILNFLREFLGLGSVTDVMEIKSVKELFDKLYLGTDLNNYTPLINNVMFDILERNSGVIMPGTKEDQVLNRQDSNTLKNSMDSIISEIVNNENNKSKDASKTLSLLLDTRNREPLYRLIKVYLEKKLSYYEEQLNNIEEKEENQIKLDILKNRIRILSTGLSAYGNASEGLVKYHLDNSAYDLMKQKYTVLELDEEGNLFDPNSITDSERYSDKKIGDQSLIQLAGKETLYILKSVHAVNKKGEFEYDELGFKKLADFRTLWNNTVRAISGLQDPQQMYNKLIEESESIPEFKQLASIVPGEGKLANPSLSTNPYEFKTTTSFWQDFNKPRVPYIQLTVFGKPVERVDGKGNVSTVYVNDTDPLLEFSVEVTDASIQTFDVIKKFEDKFKASLKNKYVERMGRENIPVLNIQKVAADFNDGNNKLDISKSYEFAKAIGFALDNIPVIKRTLVKDNKTIEQFGLPYIYSIINKLAEKETSEYTKPNILAEILKFRQNPINTLMNGIKAGVLGNSSINQKQQVKELANLQARYGSDVSNFAVLNAERNLVFEHIDNNSITKQVYALNNAKKLSDLWTTDEFQYMSHMDPAINSYTTRLRTINSLYELKSSDLRKRPNTSLKLFMDSGTQKAIDKQEEGTNTTSLDVNSKFLQELHTMLKDGVQEFMRHASKSSSFGAKIEGGIVGLPGKEGNDNHLWVDIDMFKNNTAYEYVLKAHMVPYMEAEAERIYNFRKNKDTYKFYKGYNRVMADGRMAGEVFIAFDDILSNDVKEEIYRAIDKAIAENKLFDLKSYVNSNTTALAGTIRRDIKKYFKDQTDNTVEFLEESKYISPDLYDLFKDTKLSKTEQERILVDAYVHNSWIHNFEMAILFYGDPAQIDHDKEEMHKRNTGSTSGGPGYRTDINAQKFVNDYLAKTSFAKSKNLPTISYDGTFNTAVLQDVVRKSVYMEQIEKGIRADYEKRYSGKNISQTEIDRRIEVELSKYEKMEEGDGQGFITFDAYRTLANLQNNWSNAQEVLFQKIVNNEVISSSDVYEMFPVLKAQNYGPLVSKVGNEYVTGLPITAMHKFALQPLIPSAIGSDLQSLHEQMMKKGVQYVTFQTGSKVGSITSQLNEKGEPVADKIYDDSEQKTLKKDIQFTPNRIYLEYLKNVTNVPNKYKGKTVFSTQLRKLILGGMYRNGKIINSDNEATVKQYENTVNDYSDILKYELLNEIGYTYNDETKKYSGNLDNFLDVVQRELDRRDIPEHLVQLVGLNRDKSLKTDLSLHLKADEIEKILVSLVEKRLIKQKVKGEALVQVSSAISNGLWDTQLKLKAATKEDIEKYLGTNNLPFYRPGTDGKTMAMKVAIAMQGDFNNLLKRQDVAVYDEQTVDGITNKVFNQKASLARLNELIKDDAWMDKNRQVVTLSAVRIPVQGLNSMEFMEVYEFLDPSANNIIIPPTEIVAKSGADFDVDKLTTFMPAINEKGHFIESLMSNADIKRKVEELNKTEEGKKIAARMIKTQKAALENKLITSIKGILELPDNYATLVKPNDTYLLKDDIADKIQDDVIEYDRFKNVHSDVKLGKKGQKVISPTRIFEVGYNLHKHDVNMIGKQVLGMIAVENSLHPIFNSIGAYLPKTYKASIWSREKNKYEDIDKDYEARLFLPHNKTDNGEISLSGTDTADGLDNIAELYSQMMNGAVDVEKDAWIFFIQGNYELTPMITFLLKAGVPKEQAILFVSNPLVREYAKQQRLIKSSYAKLTGTIAQDFKTSMSKYKAAELALKKFGIKENPSKLVSNNTYYQAVNQHVIDKKLLDKDGTFNLDKMKEILKDPKLNDDALRDYAFGMFLHFIELEKMSKGFTTLKMQSNPDTKTSKTLQEVIRKNLSLEDVKEISKLPKGMVEAMENSILGSFFDNQLISDMIVPLFTLRNSDEVTNFIIDKLKTQSTQIGNKFGSDKEGTRQFITKFKNAIPNYIYQNYLSNMLDDKGNITSMPEEYKKLKVKEKSGISKGVEIENDVIYIDREQLEKDFANHLYTRESKDPDSYANKGLVGFVGSNNMFPNESQYFKYVMEREYQRYLYPIDEQTENKDYQKFIILTEKFEKDPVKVKQIAYERFLNQRALINAYNRKALMEVPGGYTDMVLDIIDEFSHLKVKYPILAQLSKPNIRTGENVLTLNDLKDLKDPQLAEIYYQNILDLSDETIHKVADAKDNARISKLFKLLPIVSIYQHGLGYSKYGFNDVLPYEGYIGLMQTAADIFLNNEMSSSTLQTIYNRLIDSKSAFPNYVTTTTIYKEGSPVQPAETEDIVEYNEEIANLLSKAKKVETEPTEASVSTTNNPAEYTNHSGGAKGYDAEWDLIGAEFGMINNKHYLLPSDGAVSDPRLQAKGVKPVDATNDVGPVALQGPATGEAQIAVTNAERTMGRIESNHTTRNTKKIRNYAQVKNADAIFAIGSLIPKGADITVARGQATKKALVPQVNGGTSVAVQLGITMGKPTYVFNQVSNSTYSQGWYKWDNAKQNFVAINTPTLTKNFAGIGTSSNTTEAGKQAIRDVYAQTFAQPSTQGVNLPGPETKINIYAGTGENTELSNFAKRPFLTTGNLKFNTVEGAFQYQKIHFTDGAYTLEEADALLEKLQNTTGTEAKKIGKTIKNLNITKWDAYASRGMKKLLLESFEQNPDALAKLLATGNATLTHTQDKGKWGTEFPRLLMEVRDELRSTQPSSQGAGARKTYSGKVTSLQPNQIFVFGSNPEGRHGAGAAKYAKDNFGAIYGQGEGLQGQSYALPTKDLRVKTNNSLRSISAEDITNNIKKLYKIAKQNPTKEFLVSDYSESNLNGYTGQEMADMFTAAGPIPSNIVFNENFDKLLQPSSQGVGTQTPVANIPQNKVSGVDSYGSTVTANNEAIKALGPNPHSIDMIEAGFRTRTTRSESEMANYAVKVGDVIKHFGTSADGTTKNILAKVTAIHPKGSAGWKGTWEKEGWRAQDVNVIDRFKDGAAAIEFEVIQPSSQPVGSVKPGVDEVFSSNPELANQVYEALGFSSKLKVSLGKELEYKDPYAKNRIKDFKKYEVLDENGKSIGTVVIEDRGNNTVILHPELSVIGKGYGKELYKAISSNLNVTIQEWNEGGISKSSSAKRMWDSLEKEGAAKRIFDEESGDNFRELKYQPQINPQQEQQAKQLYSQYLNTIFPDSKVKDIVYHGTKENFENFSKEIAEKRTGFHFTTKIGLENSRFNFPKTTKIVLLNITAPLNTEDLGANNKWAKDLLIKQGKLEEAKKIKGWDIQKESSPNNDGFIYTNQADNEGKGEISYMVFEPEQIHILGNKQDIEGFKEFIKNTPEMKKDTPIQPEVSDMIRPEGLPAIPRTSSSCK